MRAPFPAAGRRWLAAGVAIRHAVAGDVRVQARRAARPGRAGSSRRRSRGSCAGSRSPYQHRVQPGGDVAVVVEAQDLRLGQRLGQAAIRTARPGSPTATTRALPDAAPSSSAMDSCLAASMKPQVLTQDAAPGVAVRPASVQPAASSRPASSSESTSLRAQPRVTRLTVRPAPAGSPDSTAHRQTTVSPAACRPRRLRTASARAQPVAAGQLRPWPEAQRHRLAGRARLSPGSCRSRSAGSRPGCRSAWSPRVLERPGLRCSRSAHSPVRSGSRRRRGELDPAVLDGGQPDDHGRRGGVGRGWREGCGAADGWWRRLGAPAPWPR